MQGVLQGMTNWTTFAIGASSLALILIFKRRWPKIPGVLIAVIAATVVVGVFDLAAKAGVSVVGPLPQGLPSFQFPAVSFSYLPTLLAGAVAITLVSFADTSVLSRTFALRGGYKVDQNQEIIALGAANVASGLFQGFSISSSSSRTPVAEQAGAKTQLTGVVGALCIALLSGIRAFAAAEPAQCGPGRRGDLGVHFPGGCAECYPPCGGSAPVSSGSRWSVSLASRS